MTLEQRYDHLKLCYGRCRSPSISNELVDISWPRRQLEDKIVLKHELATSSTMICCFACPVFLRLSWDIFYRHMMAAAAVALH
jgi:hypothetical protein